MCPILFFSRLLTDAKRNYWPTKLKIARFVWVLKKIKHPADSSEKPVIVQTDHLAILDIMKQTSIVLTPSTMRMNVRLICASQFLRQFWLDVCHKPRKDHIVPDALSRLASLNDRGRQPNYSELDALFTCALVGKARTF